MSTRAELEATYDRFLKDVDNRSFARCDTLSGEQIMAVNIKGEVVAPTAAVLVFERKGTNKPHIRTVILGWDEGPKWHVRSENTVVLPVERPSSQAPVVDTSNTPDTVPSVHSVTLTGTQVDFIKAFVKVARTTPRKVDQLLDYLEVVFQ